MDAIAHIAAHARPRQAQARLVLDNILAMANIPPARLDQARSAIASRARIALHFHPDRLDGQGRTVAQGLLEDGCYRSQFETGLSSGMLSPELGGPRDRWEGQLFGTSYPGLDHRPKYGALDLLLHPDGPSPRFGSCYLLLKPAVLASSTFCYADSHLVPREKGTIAVFDDVLAALFRDCFERHYALGRGHIKPGQLVDHLCERLAAPIAERFSQSPARTLDHYIEAQIHGQVTLADDAEALVADPSFQGTETGRLLARLCDRYGVALHWHGGFRLRPAAVPDDFRGPAMPALARQVARNGWVDAHAIGLAAAEVKHGACHDQGERLQRLKLLWHVLVKFGEAHGG
ncbi:DUF3626 domain-containing protein [Gallaecimonas sp. GXIMD4217]|uniref:DUF3626 domain-containing protein n=1 Tax=Gallaecimonas sp. GXIMD4217 TaxID=3131927 RepID=UPI00311B307A